MINQNTVTSKCELNAVSTLKDPKVTLQHTPVLNNSSESES